MPEQLEPQPAATSPTMPQPDPDRERWVREATTRILAALTDQLLRGVESSTASTMSERLMLTALRPWLPQLRGVLLAKLSAGNGAQLEVLAGAIATALEDMLDAAPGVALPRMRPIWTAERTLALVPVDGPAA